MIPTVEDALVAACNNEISVILPLTKATGKIRLKLRNSFCEYGVPFASRQTPISLQTYVEWQIGYDLLATSTNANKTSLRNKPFTKENLNGHTNYLKYCIIHLTIT